MRKPSHVLVRGSPGQRLVALVLTAGFAIAAPAQAGSEYAFEVTPYLWGATIGGNVATASRPTTA